MFVNVNVKVKESWEIEGPVGLAPAERGPTKLRECECEREGEGGKWKVEKEVRI